MTRGIASRQIIASAYAKSWVQSQVLKNQTKPKWYQGKEGWGAVLGTSTASVLVTSCVAGGCHAAV